MTPVLKTVLLKQDTSLAESVSVTLAHKFWKVQAKPTTIRDVVVAEQATQRRNTSQTKDRAAVSGGGRKPWKQKGTGRARHGSRRSPIWVGGGITFGPTNQRNYHKKTNRKIFNKVLAGLLATRLREKRLFITENCVLPKPQTKALIALFNSWQLDYKKDKILWIGVDFPPNLFLSSQNLAQVHLLEVQNISIWALLNSTKLLITKTALAQLATRLDDVSH